MEHSLEWITESLGAYNRVQARRALRLAQAVSCIMDSSAWPEAQQRLIDEMTSYE